MQEAVTAPAAGAASPGPGISCSRLCSSPELAAHRPSPPRSAFEGLHHRRALDLLHDEVATLVGEVVDPGHGVALLGDVGQDPGLGALVVGVAGTPQHGPVAQVEHVTVTALGEESIGG